MNTMSQNKKINTLYYIILNKIKDKNDYKNRKYTRRSKNKINKF